MRPFQRILAALLVAGGCGGGEAARTGILVAIESEYAVPGEINRLRITVSNAAGQDGGASARDSYFDLGPGKYQLPGRMAVEPANGASGRVHIEIQGLLGAEKIVSGSATVDFLPGRVVLLEIFLRKICRQRVCGPGQTCDQSGACVSDSVDATRLPSPSRPDGGMQEADGPAARDVAEGPDRSQAADADRPPSWDMAPPVDGADGGGPCGVPEMEPNDTKESATPYTAGTPVVGCLSTREDVDLYQLTSPAADPAGGYYEAAITDVGNGSVFVKLYTASDEAVILDHVYSPDLGGSLYFYWAAAPGQTYRISVTSYFWNAPYTYTLRASYTRVDDAFEPNDTREQAKPISLGAPTRGFFFAGFKAKVIDEEDYADWYSLDLPAAGMTTIQLRDVASDVLPHLRIYDAQGAMVDQQFQTTAGASIDVSRAIASPGVHTLRVDTFSLIPRGAAKIEAPGKVPDSFKRPYTLTITQP